ncbi:MAG TPA: ChbG/HpnK family deacetylase [Candidatus Acidoferrales bacterium]|nr:ChbG/HpnK family deacetylase [Candidatus Acidoferrales bacterium]
MKWLIVNADDFGYTRGVNAGTVRGFREGIVTSTTIMANGDAFEDAIECAQANPKLGVGCHLVLVGGKCVAPAKQVSSLVNSEGCLPPSLPVLLSKLSAGSVRPQEIETELRAQVERVIASGLRPTHFDSHKHTHAHPKVMEVVVQVAEEFKVTRIRKPFEDTKALLWPVFRDLGSWKQRATALIAGVNASGFQKLASSHGIRTPDHFMGVAATGRLNRQAILAMIGAMRDGVTELMCHPGEYDEELAKSPTRLKREREAELNGLTDPDVRTAIRQHGLRLVNFQELDGNNA